MLRPGNAAQNHLLLATPVFAQVPLLSQWPGFPYLCRSADSAGMRARKVRLSPQQSRILWVLEEAGEESAQTVLATLRAEAVFDEHQFSEDVAGLEHLGYIIRQEDNFILTKPGYAALSK